MKRQKKRRAMKKWTALLMAGCMAFTALPPFQAEASGQEKRQVWSAITDMTVEYQKNPIGLETNSIHFSWKMSSNEIGARQTAYELKVYEEADRALVWDSGKVEGRLSVGIPYGGEEELKEGTRYLWEVVLWNQDEEMLVSEEAFFETGVTNQQEWKDAQFIRLNGSRSAPIFRTEQDLKKGAQISAARLYITSMGAYEAYINGQQVGVLQEDGAMEYHHMNPGYGNKEVSLGYQTYDVTSMLAGSEKAAISVVAGTGWYFGMGATSSQPAIKALMTIRYEDGTRQIIQTNTEDWKGTLEGPIVANGVYYGEDYDARLAKELGDFTQVGYDDSDWADGEDLAQIPFIENEFARQQARYVRLSVYETGPAYGNENLLQIMELELLDEEGINVVSQRIPAVTNTWSPNQQWSPEHLADGDRGEDTDYGYTSQLLGTEGLASFRLSEPICFTFDLGETTDFQTLRMYPRTKADSVSEQECPNYPKTYSLEVSNDGSLWEPVIIEGQETHTVESLVNTLRYQQAEPVTIETSLDQAVTTSDIRISVSQIGPADDSGETLLQIMEMELLDAEGKNAALGVTPVASNEWLPSPAADQWGIQYMTDGDRGETSDAGYTSTVLAREGLTSYTPTEPLTIDFHLETPVNLSGVKIYPRTVKDSVWGSACPNYPKVFTVQVSDDGGSTWRDVKTMDAGVVRNTMKTGKTTMSVTDYPGKTIRAQTAIPGKILDQYEKKPISVTLYTNQAESSSLPGGEIDVDAYYAYQIPQDAMYAGDYHPVEEGTSIFGEGITLKKGQTMIVNMGQNMSAIPEFQFLAKEGTVLTATFAEMLNDGSQSGSGATQADGPKGSLYKKSLRNARSSVKYQFAGEGIEVYQPSMSFFGYQYVEITATDDVTFYGLRSRALSSVSRQTGWIETNNQDVNQLFSNVLYGQLSNYLTTPTDCNQRDERLSWTGDTQAFAQTAVYNFDSLAFLSEMQDIYNENTMEMGYVPSVADILNGYFNWWSPGWSDVEVILPWTLYQQTGDRTILEDSWDALVRYMDYMQGRRGGRNGHAPVSGVDQNYGDWLSFQGTSIEVMNDFYYAYVNQLMEKIAKTLGEEDKAREYAQTFQQVREAFLRDFVDFDAQTKKLTVKSGIIDGYTNVSLQFQSWSDKKGVWEHNSQTSLLWFLKLGFYEGEDMRQAAIDLLADNIRAENQPEESIRKGAVKNTLSTGFLGSNVIAPVLTQIGEAEVSYDLLLQDEQPSWLFEVKAGATTVWERWNSYTPGQGFGDSEMNSFNHYAYGSVAEWMYRYMAGIAADEEQPGFQHILLQPTLDTGTAYNDQERIHEVHASYESYYGTIRSAWTSQEAELSTYQTSIPANTTASLYLPVDAEALEDFAAIPGVAYQGMTVHNGRTAAKFLLESGGYDFEVRDGKLTVGYGAGYEGSDAQKKELESLQIVSLPEKTNYMQGEPLKMKGLSLKAVYRDGSERILEYADCRISGYDPQRLGWQMIEIGYTEEGITVRTQMSVHVEKKQPQVPEKPNPPADSGTVEERPAASDQVKKGTVFQKKGLRYEVTTIKGKKKTVRVQGPVKKNVKKVAIPATVTYKGVKYQVTDIGKRAFFRCKRLARVTVGANVQIIGKQAFSKTAKLKNIILKTKKLKKVGAQSLRGLHKKAVVRMPKGKKRTYQRLLKKAGYRGSIRVK